MIEYFQFLGQEVYKILFLIIPILVSVAMIVWLDRRVWGLVQKRKGPNVVGPFGLFQTLADALKYIFKEIIIPASANKTVFITSQAKKSSPCATKFNSSCICKTTHINHKVIAITSNQFKFVKNL